MSAVEFKEFINGSNISDGDKSFWGQALTYMNDDEVGQTARFINGNQRVLVFHTDTLRRKYRAFSDNNPQLFRDALAMEQEFIEAI